MNKYFQFFTQNQYRKEITLVICLKVIAIFILWKLCFSHPESRSITPDKMVQRFANMSSRKVAKPLMRDPYK
jgi:hypothetical protein